ncbi:MAG TPA: HAD hydrolase-like protein [Blastocatellia bacterium]|nr:HAD hydrolase-like protein [Blastocatellia bacterium]
MTDRRTILFDLDGTLIDTTSLILACFEHSWRTVAGRSHDREELIGTFGMPLNQAVSSLASEGDLALDSDQAERLLLAYRSFNLANHDSMVREFPGVRQAMAELKERGYLVGVVTSKGREIGRRGLELCSLSCFLDVAVFLEDTDHHKPRPEPLLKALELLGARAGLAAYVGDSPYDLIAGRAAGMRTVAALWGPAARESLEQEHPDFKAESISDLLEIF